MVKLSKSGIVKLVGQSAADQVDITSLVDQCPVTGRRRLEGSGQGLGLILVRSSIFHLSQADLPGLTEPLTDGQTNELIMIS